MNNVKRSNAWTMASVWNSALENKEERKAQERQRIWASELGKPPIEVFLKMRGVQPTNPPNPRSRRKFEAGNMFEWIVGLVLKRAGILKEGQKWVGHTYPGLLEVSGKIDFIAGGVPDYEHYKANLEALELPEFFMRASDAIIAHFQKNYPDGLGDLFLEIKSCSSFMMDAMERTGNASRNHRLQLFHYEKAEGFPRGNIVYICRDDLRMMEIPVLNPSPVEEEYRQAIAEISAVYNAHKDTPLDKFLIKPDTSDVLKWTWVPLDGLPQLEKFIVWDKDLKKFSRNWGVEYSSYLTMLYGFETQKQFEDLVMPMVSRWNRVLSRVKDNAKMTEKNIAVLAEMGREGYNIQELAKEFVGEPEETEEVAAA